MSQQTDHDCPTALEIEYPDRDLDRLTTFFRLFAAIPILIVLGSIAGGPMGWEHGPWEWEWSGIPSFLVIPTALMIIFKEKYPRWWFNWNLNLSRFIGRVFSYLALLTDVYPSTDDEQGVHLDLYYPQPQKDLNRWLPLIKWFLAIPHYLVLIFINLAGFMVVVMAWFAILFTGRYPEKLFDFVVDVLRWNLRVIAYVALLITDKYPPFNFAGWQGENGQASSEKGSET